MLRNITNSNKKASPIGGKKINNLTIFKSSRIIYSNNQVFLSKTALIENKPATGFSQLLSDIKDISSLGKELESSYIFNL